MSPSAPKDVAHSLHKLKLSTSKPSTTPKKAAPADSWEDEADHSSDTETEISTPVRPRTSDLPAPPPPTPASPSAFRSSHGPSTPNYQSHAFGGLLDGTFDPIPAKAPTQGEERRPDKTTAVASRLIAAGIGQRAPKRTEEQKQYDQAMKIQEKKKRDQAREEEERKKREKAQAQKSIWED